MPGRGACSICLSDRDPPAGPRRQGGIGQADREGIAIRSADRARARLPGSIARICAIGDPGPRAGSLRSTEGGEEVKHIDVILRCCPGTTPQWQYYSLGVSILGGAETLAEAKAAALEALEFELDGEEFTALFHTEMLGAEATADRPAVWVRALQDPDDRRRLSRRREQLRLIQRMQSQPDLVDRTFDDLPAATGDIIAVVGFADDVVQFATRQTSPVGSIWVGISDQDSITWFGMDSSPRERNGNRPSSLEEIGVTPGSTLGELIAATDGVDSLSAANKRLIAV